MAPAGRPGRSLLLLLVLASAAPAAAQPAPADTLRADTLRADTTATEADEAVLEGVAEDDGAATEVEDLADVLDDLRANPLDINSATQEELAQIPALGPLVAANLVGFRQQFGPFASMPELRAVEGVTEAAYFGARPYLTIGETLTTTAGPPPRFPRVPRLDWVRAGMRVEVRQRVQRRLDTGPGYRDDTTRTTYAGSPERLYTRLSARYRRQISLNLTLEKDPGEAFGWNPEQGTYGYDHVTGHLAVARMGRIETLIVGDYTAQFGQGVALWRAGGFGKGRETTRALARTSRGLAPYGSAEENRFLRGAAATLALTPTLYASAFASRRTRDATVDTVFVEADEPDDLDGFDEEASVTGLGETGLHRTPSEIARKDALDETLVGGGVEYRPARHTVGVVAYRAHYGAPFVRGDRPDQRFAFTGATASMVSAYGTLRLPRAHAFAEVARDPDGTFGGLAGLLAAPDKAVELLLLARAYPADFTSPYGFAFGERNGVTQNEQGVYLGVRLRPSRPWEVSAFFDQYRFPYLRFNVPRPTVGHEALVAVTHRPTRWLEVYVQARTESREVGIDVPTPTGAVLGGLTTQTRQTLRVHGSYQAARWLRLRARFEGSRFVEGDAATRYGTLLFQDVRVQPFPRLRLDARLLFFDTDGFDTRLYAFENDVAGVLTNPVFSGRGTRRYVVAAYEPLRGLFVEGKFAVTRFEDVFTVGSGLDEVEGNRVRDVSVQVRYRW